VASPSTLAGGHRRVARGAPKGAPRLSRGSDRIVGSLEVGLAWRGSGQGDRDWPALRRWRRGRGGTTAATPSSPRPQGSGRR
jgi:hypothetical protein